MKIPQFLKISVDKTPKKQICSSLAISNQDGQKNHNEKQLRLFFAIFPTNVIMRVGRGMFVATRVSGGVM